jgi:hypothetical protein
MQMMFQEERVLEYSKMDCCCFGEEKTKAILVKRKIT